MTFYHESTAMPLSGLLLTSQACDLNLNHLKEYFFLRNIFFYIAEKRVEEASNGNSRTGTVMKKNWQRLQKGDSQEIMQ